MLATSICGSSTAQLIDYDETAGDHFDHLYRMVDGSWAVQGIEQAAQRQARRHRWSSFGRPSPAAVLQLVLGDAEEAFFVVHHCCAAITTSIAARVGHILGARHDRADRREWIHVPLCSRVYQRHQVAGRLWATTKRAAAARAFPSGQTPGSRTRASPPAP